jgi:hypothetical protein
MSTQSLFLQGVFFDPTLLSLCVKPYIYLVDKLKTVRRSCWTYTGHIYMYNHVVRNRSIFFGAAAGAVAPAYLSRKYNTISIVSLPWSKPKSKQRGR